MRFSAVLVLLGLSTATAAARCSSPFPLDQKIGEADLKRAIQKVPRDDFKGTGISHMAFTLNGKLHAIAKETSGLVLKHCEDMAIDELHAIQKVIVRASHPDFQEIYAKTGDNRRYRFCGMKELEGKYEKESAIVLKHPELSPMLRDAKCREAVMWYVHHLRHDEKQALHKSGFLLPTLPDDELKPDATLLLQKEASAQTIHDAYNESLACTTCHNTKFPTGHKWPSTMGVNKRTGEKLPAWPDAFSIDEFLLEVTTEPGYPGLPNISNTPGNSFYYSYDRTDPSKARALNVHKVCPFFHKKSCNIYHRPEGIFLHINPGKPLSLCCKFQAIAVIPPFWTTWGNYYATYQKGEHVPYESQPNNEGFVVDRFMYGAPNQLDEHDLHVRAENGKALVRFHATLPPPNNRSHGYWHVTSEMRVGPQDPKLFTLPKFCLPSCGLEEELAELQVDGSARATPPRPTAHNMLFPWGKLQQHHVHKLDELAAKLSLQTN